MSDQDTQIIADQERRIARLRAELERVEQCQQETHELIVERFNPPDDDAWHEEDSIKIAADFIESLPCECTPEQIEDYDACRRCRVLGRRGDEPVSR